MDSKIQNKGLKYTLAAYKGVNYKNTTLSEFYLPMADSVENFEVYEDDIWLCGFPKSGTTWAQEMIWNIANDSNLEAVKAKTLERFPLFEYSGIFKYETTPLKETDSSGPSPPAYFLNSLEYAKNSPRPRFIKTHLPFHLLPRQLRTNEKKAKLIYIWRNPKDACISSYYYIKWTSSWMSIGDLTSFCKLFLNGGVPYTPYFNHLIEYWNRRNDDNILFLKYEDMKANLPSEIRRTANFLGKNLNDDRISKLEKYLSFSSMSKNPATRQEDMAESNECRTDGKFLRKGEAGQWKTEMSSEMIDQFDKWIHENVKNNESLLRELL